MHRHTIGKWLLGIGLLLGLTDIFMVVVDAANPAKAPQQVSSSVLSLSPTPAAGSTATGTTGSSSINATATVTPTVIPVDQIPALMQKTWQSYKKDFIQGDGRVIDHGRNGVSTSEGESYALLRAVWMHDRHTFDLVWTWSRNNLQVRKDHLLGYLWGRHPNNLYYILDKDSATDADEDTATALLFAAHVFHNPAYYHEARAIINDIWRMEVTTIKGHPYLTAGNWGPSWNKPGPALNPSYFAPYEYRIFAVVDKSHPWLQIVDSSYKMLFTCSSQSLDTGRSVGLPPNWCAILRSTGTVTSMQATNLGTLYGFDAFRSMWRTALDYSWNYDPRAKAYLDGRYFLHQQWQQHGLIFAQYTHDGAVLEPAEDPTLYGGNIGAFVFSDPPSAVTIAQQKLLSSYKFVNGVSYWGDRYSYYEQNWVWFGLGLLDHQLPDLSH